MSRGRRRFALAGLLLGGSAALAGPSAGPVALAVAAGAVPLPAGSARLVGTFQLGGRITAAKGVRGEHRGDEVTRVWTFTPLCPSGPCSHVRLVRQRQAGSDTTTLQATSPRTYVGHGRFYAPLRCAGRVRQRGESVPFTIKVSVTAVGTVSGVPVASRVHATYVNRRRRNLTRCVAVPGHDAAVYDGGIVSGAAAST